MVADMVADMNSARQSILTRESAPFELRAVVHEVALLNEFEGRPYIRKDQHRRLKELSERPDVTIQIVPLCRSVHPGSLGDFEILSYDGGGATVYRELPASSLMTTDAEEVAACQAAAKTLSAEVTLSAEQSAAR
nr:Scr1 family TA system antitoxin-like transcriptional regulator [Streptomyces graminilatus]